MNTRSFLPITLFAFLPLLGCSGALDGRTGSSSQDETVAPCTVSLADYCALHSCLTTWSAADEACMTADPGTARFSTTCGGYDVHEHGGTTGYYEASTGGLLAIVDGNGQCLAGALDFRQPAATSCPLMECGMFSCGGEGGAP